MPHLIESIGITTSEDKIDSERGIIKDVRILGSSSKNSGGKRKYSKQGMAKRIKENAYDGVNVFLTHKSGERQYTERFGKIRNTTLSEDSDGPCIRGDLHYNRKHPNTDMILEDIVRFDSGLSHHAVGREGRDHIVEDWSVKSVDIVHNAATNKSLWESEPLETTIKELYETLSDKLKESLHGKFLKLLVEEEPDAQVETSEDMTPEDMLRKAISDVMKANVDSFAKGDIDIKALLANLKELGKKAESKKPAEPDSADKEPNVDDAETPPEEEPTESIKDTKEDDMLKEEVATLKTKLAKAEAKTELQEHSIDPTDIRISMLSKCEGEERKALLESWETTNTNRNAPRTSPPKNKGEVKSYNELKEEAGFYATKS